MTGVDLSAGMLDLARNNNPGVELICKDLQEIDFPDDSYDAIILSFCIVHLTDPETTSLLTKVFSVDYLNMLLPNER